jgi:hypothetical protein
MASGNNNVPLKESWNSKFKPLLQRKHQRQKMPLKLISLPVIKNCLRYLGLEA